jgi:hypothetical protein
MFLFKLNHHHLSDHLTFINTALAAAFICSMLLGHHYNKFAVAACEQQLQSSSSSLRKQQQQQVVYGFKNYTEMVLGDLNILISVPHDGLLRPAAISNRTEDSIGNLISDFNTRKFANVLRSELVSLFANNKTANSQGGHYPFIIYNNLHR